MNPILFQAFPNNKITIKRKNLFDCNNNKIISYIYTPGLGTEYELFKEIYANQNPVAPWGLVSSKFELKCPIKIEEFYDYAENEFQNGADCVFINPMLINEALFLNVWEQGIVVGHHGLDKIQKYLIENKFVTNNIMGTNTFAFNNYFIGNNNFWDKYFKYIDLIMDDFHQEEKFGSETGLIFSKSGNYHKNKSMSMRPFVIERLFSSFIEKYKHELKLSSYKYENHHYIFKCGENYGNSLYKLSALKNENISNIKSLNKWNEIRKIIIMNKAIFYGLLHLDDPDEIIISVTNNI